MSKKNVSALPKGNDVAKAIFTRLARKAKARQLGIEDLRRLAAPEGDSFLDKLVELMVRANPPKHPTSTITSYTVSVDTGLTPLEIVKSDMFTDIDSEEFLSGRSPFKARAGGERELLLVHFDRRIRDSPVDAESELLSELDRLGLRPEGLPELCALGARRTRQRSQLPIIMARGAAYTVDRSCYKQLVCPVLVEGRKSPRLSFRSAHSDWPRAFHFLASRK
jgi:hypothetical protein